MRIENQKMAAFLKENGITASVKYFYNSSEKGAWRIFNCNVTWQNNTELQSKFTALGFKNWDGQTCGNFQSNGSCLAIFVKHAELTAKFCENL
jgi:hypothetical protein